MDGATQFQVPPMVMTASYRFTPGSRNADGKTDGKTLSIDMDQDDHNIPNGKDEKKYPEEEIEWLPPTPESLKTYVPVHWRTLECANCRYELKKLEAHRQPILLYMGKERKDVNGEEERFPVYLCSGECAKRYILDRIELDNHKLLPRLDQHLRDDHGYTEFIAVAPQPILIKGIWPGPNPMSIDQYRAQFQKPYILVRQLKPFVFEDEVLARIPKDIYQPSAIPEMTPLGIQAPVPLSDKDKEKDKKGRVYSSSYPVVSAAKLLSASYPRMTLSTTT